MFDRALVALELSPAAEAFLRDLLWLERLGTREMILAHVVEPDTPNPELAHARLRALGGYLHAQGFLWSQKVAHGEAARELVRLIPGVQASYLVVGARSRREGREGRVALDLLRASPVPVLLVRTHTELLEGPLVDPLHPEAPAAPPPERVLFPTDFSSSADAAFSWVEGAVSAGLRTVDLLHATEGGASARGEAQGKLERWSERLRAAGATRVEARVVTGSPDRAILAAAREAPRPLVIMGSQGRGFVARALLGSVTRSVARELEAPLLLVPRP